MKLRVEFCYLAPDSERYTCINDSEYDGAEDAGHQMVGYGPTAEAARADFMEQWMERECERDCARAVKFAQTWDMFLMRIFG